MFDPTPDWNDDEVVELTLSGKWAAETGLTVKIRREHYQWATQWQWHLRRSKDRKNPKHKVKWYVTRVTTAGSKGRQITIYMHKELCHMVHGKPPSKRHIISDHLNGDSLDCRAYPEVDDPRNNLRWATPKMNRENYNGFYALQLRLSFGKDTSRIDRFHKRRTKYGNRDKIEVRPTVRDEQGVPTGDDCPF